MPTWLLSASGIPEEWQNIIQVLQNYSLLRKFSEFYTSIINIYPQIQMSLNEHVQERVGENLGWQHWGQDWSVLSLVALLGAVNHSTEVDLFPNSHTQNRI